MLSFFYYMANYRDGKGNFYRQLNLDKDTMLIIRWFRKIKRDLIKGHKPK